MTVTLYRLHPQNLQILDDLSKSVGERNDKVAADAAKKLEELEDALARARRNKVWLLKIPNSTRVNTAFAR